MGRVADTCFDWYVRRLVSRHFASVRWLRTDLQVRHRESRGHDGPGSPSSAILVANHTNWWDGFLGWLVSRRMGLPFHILMDAANLDRYWMFKWIGALPMHRDSASAGYRDLVEAGLRLKESPRTLWIFPQGERRPAAEPVGNTERGAAHLAVGQGLPVIPVAVRYAYLGEQLPEAFLLLGDEIDVTGMNRRDAATEIEQRLQRTVEALDARLRTEAVEDFELLLQGRLSINKRLDRVRHAAGTIDGPFERRNG